jgi:hypothetical protein
MSKALPSRTASADEVQRRLTRAPDRKQRQRLHALSLAASGPARPRPESAALRGVHRHRGRRGCQPRPRAVASTPSAIRGPGLLGRGASPTRP